VISYGKCCCEMEFHTVLYTTFNQVYGLPQHIFLFQHVYMTFNAGSSMLFARCATWAIVGWGQSLVAGAFRHEL